MGQFLWNPGSHFVYSANKYSDKPNLNQFLSFSFHTTDQFQPSEFIKLLQPIPVTLLIFSNRIQFQRN